MGEYKKGDKKSDSGFNKSFERKPRKFDQNGEQNQNKRFKPSPKDEKPKAPAVLTKQDRKDLRKKRRSQKKHAETAEEVLKVFAAGVSHMEKEERRATMGKLIETCRGKFYDLALRHDTSRAIQLAIKHGNVEQRNEIVKELAGKYSELCKNKTGHFVVLKVVQYCSTEHKQTILDEFRGKLRKLAVLADGAQVLDYLYMTATKAQQYIMLREFMDQSYAVFKNDSVATTLKFQTEEKLAEDLKKKAAQDTSNAQLALAALSEAEIKKQPENLLAWLIARDPERKAVMLDTLEVFLTRIMEKEMLMFRFFHSLLLQYLQNASITSSATREIISNLNKYILALHDSKDGVACAVHALAYGTAKDRKNAIKALKGRVVEMSLHEHAYMIVVKVIDVTDDTVLLRKQIINELTASATFGVAPYLAQLATSKPGAKVLFYLLAPHTSAFFSKDELKALEAVYVPAYVLAKKQDDKDDETKDAKTEEKESDKDYERMAKESEKERLAKKEAELAEAATASMEMVKTSKKSVEDKVYELSPVILEPLLKTLLLTIAEARGTAGTGSVSTSNIDISAKKKMSDEDDEDAEDEDVEVAVKVHTNKDVGKPFAVLNGVMKHRVGLEVIYAALLCAYNYHTKDQESAAKGTFASATAVADTILDGMATLTAEGDVWDQQGEKKGTATDDSGLGYNDDSHPLVNSCSHLLYKRLFQSLPEAPRNKFAEKLWANVSQDKDLLTRVVSQNRPGLVLANMLDNCSIRAVASKVLAKVLPKETKGSPTGVELLRRVVKGGSAAKEAPKPVEVPKVEEVVMQDEEPVVEKKVAAARTPRASKRKPVEELEAEVMPLSAAPPTPLRRSARITSNPPTPLSAPASTSLTPRRSSRRNKDEDMPAFTLEKVIEEEEEETPAPAKSPRKGRKAAVPVVDSDDEEEVAEIKKAAKATRKTRK